MSIDLKSIIDFAIENEVESYEFYRDASKKVKDSVLKETFEKLSMEELKHRDYLKELLEKDLKSFKVKETEDYGISETVDEVELSVNMEFKDAIALAIKKEEEAMYMYKSLADSCNDISEKEIFINLMNMEQLHKNQLEDIYINIAYAEIW